MGIGSLINCAVTEENNKVVRQRLLNKKGNSNKEYLGILPVYKFKNTRIEIYTTNTLQSMAVTCLCDSCMQGDKAFCLQRRAEHPTEQLNLAQIWRSQMGDRGGFIDALMQTAFKSLRIFDYIGDGAHGFVYRGSVILPQSTVAQAHVSQQLSNRLGDGDTSIGVRGQVAVKHSVCSVSEAIEYAQEAVFASCLVHPNIALSLGCFLMSDSESARRSIEPYLSSPGFFSAHPR